MKYLVSVTAIISTMTFLSAPVVFSDSKWWKGDDDKYERGDRSYKYGYGRDDDDDDDDHDHKYGREDKHNFSRFSGPAPQVFKEECGECHMVYPSAFLPERSWRKMMSGLEDHFGDNAELDAETNQIITDYLVSNSADATRSGRSSKFYRSIRRSDTPLRISEIPYFVNEHDEVPNRLVKGNPKVNSFSNCQACHQDAEKGSFDEDDINIPGYGRWDD